MSNFEKYRRGGAYHWRQADSRWSNQVFNPPLVARYIALARMLPCQARDILDIGCGDGYLMGLIANNVSRRVYGVDVNHLGLRLARRQLSQHTCMSAWFISLASANHLPFPAEHLDCVLLADVIEHLEQPRLALDEAGRVLRNGGALLLSTPNRQPDRVWDRLHAQEFSAEELETLLGKHFTDIRIRACWPMGWLRWWKRGGRWRWLVNTLSRLGYNPFLRTTDRPSVNYGQLIVVCYRR